MGGREQPVATRSARAAEKGRERARDGRGGYASFFPKSRRNVMSFKEEKNAVQYNVVVT
jgi:hypothetical protein